MSVKLKNPLKPTWISIYDMEDGDIAIIRTWTFDTAVGRIVQRYKDILITVGQHSGKSYPSCLSGKDDGKCFVELLPSGTELVID
jgi:hypothetical protein